ncbi:hypothetical protein E2562_003822 [Oryza meyeriana var. granulata]|uniref:Uncharacterized protein n=1 Tax=Oryza meyeriana var. granulata TaxID=110450 RepID=A0A6G1BRY7_9ORYZ|nr:hypothetical protein E2562_003822 [Oryza meyeriana var. granulata]
MWCFGSYLILHRVGQRAAANISDRAAQSEANNKRLIHFSTFKVYDRTIGNFLPTDHPPSPQEPDVAACYVK